MDKNTIIGFILMGVVIVAFSWLSKPSQEQIEQQRHYNDSIMAVQRRADSLAKLSATASALSNNDTTTTHSDSLSLLQHQQTYGVFAAATQGQDKSLTLENDSVKLTFSTKGAVLTSATMKKYKDYNGKLVELIRPGESTLNFSLITAKNRIINTKDLFFKSETVGKNKIVFTATADNGASFSLIYTLTRKYLVQMQIVSHGLEKILAPNTPYLDAHMEIPIYQNEKSRKSEDRYSGIAYQLENGDVEKQSTSKNYTDDQVTGSVKWIAFRDMFFSTVILSADNFTRASLTSKIDPDSSNRLKTLSALFSVPIDPTKEQAANLLIFVGPNDYSLYKDIDKELGQGTHLAKIVDMGDWFRFINVWLVIPIFEFLQTIFSNYGIIIFLLTLIIKLLLSPFTYKSFLSQAKMRVLRPQVEEINKKYDGKDKMMERQKATMELYSRAGASTMGGCLPMLLQMPFLIAMYQYFPTSINLRGESFLWAHDLSTYDDLIHFNFNIPLIGDHISLFCLLMTITQVFYMKLSQASTPQQPGMAALKYMPYMMSVMFFVFLNQSAAGLSYYYLLSMLITILQTVLFRYAIDEKKLLAKMEANKKKPLKKSKFMQRLEEMQKQQQQLKNQKR